MSGLRLGLIGMLLTAGAMFAAAGDEHTFEMQWQKDGFSDSVSSRLDRTEPFAKEPDFGQREILRGELSIGPSEKRELMGFAWDKSEGKLYADLNRDGDLTNDPNGVLETSDSRNGQYCNQNFPTFPVSFSTVQGVYHYRLRAFLQKYAERYKNALFYVDSGYAGTTELYGRRWTFKVVDKLAGAIGQGNQWSVFSADNSISNSIRSLPLPMSLFLDGRCYDISFEFKKSEKPSPSLWCTLREKTVPTGKLRVEGKWIQRLVLGDGQILILSEPVEGVATVPAGNFTVKQCSLNYDPTLPEVSPIRLEEIKVYVPDSNEGVLRIGGPLNSQVRVQRMGKVLKFDYELIGAGGEKYDAQQVTRYDNSKKPSVAIYKGNMLLATGEFEFG